MRKILVVIVTIFLVLSRFAEGSAAVSEAACAAGLEQGTYLALTTGLDIDNNGIIDQADINAFNLAYPSTTTLLEGTAEIIKGATLVVGVNTLFTKELTAGNHIEIGIIPYVVASIIDATHLVLTSAYQGAAEYSTALILHRENNGYDRRFDINFDGVIDSKDKAWFEACATGAPNLRQIRAAIKTGGGIVLTWPEGFTASLEILSKDETTLQKFTGNLAGGVEGWLHISTHPYIPLTSMGEYVCHNFALDTAIAGYKALGHGTLLVGASGYHAYNMYVVDKNWQDLHNWRILEPQNGSIRNAAEQGTAGMGEAAEAMYRTEWICFPEYVGTDGDVCYEYLCVDYATATVTYATLAQAGWRGLYLGAAATSEERLPTGYNFNASLGSASPATFVKNKPLLFYRQGNLILP